MATFTQLLDDLAVIQKLADLPNQNDGLTASQLKAKFDEAPETVQDYINNTLIPELEKTTAESGASRIGVETISGLSGNDVQAVLESIKAYLDSNLGTINEKADKTYVDAQDANLQGQITSNDGDISTLQTVKADKTYVDSQDSNLQGQITSNDNDITNLQNNKANITYVDGEVSDLQGQISSNDSDISSLQSTKADKTNVIEKNSTVAYTPTTQYHPANKKYVDETVTAVAVGNLPEDSVTNAYLGADVKVGSLASLTTSEKSTVVGAINELDGEIGDISTLNTDDKSDVASAINELHDEINVPETVTHTQESSIASLPVGSVDGPVDEVEFKGLSLVNSVVNGDFSDGTTGWTPIFSTLSVTNNILSVTGDGGNAAVIGDTASANDIGFTVGDKFFVFSSAKVTNSDCIVIDLEGKGRTSGTFPISTISNPQSNVRYNLYGFCDTSGFINGLYLRLRHKYPDAATANGKVMEIDGNAGVFAINMTALGIEDYTEAQMLDLVRGGYFEGLANVENLKVETVGNNLLNPKDFIDRISEVKTTSYGVENDGVKYIEINAYPDYSFYPKNIKENTQYTFTYKAKRVAGTGSFLVYLYHTDGTYVSGHVSSDVYTQKTITSQYGKTVQRIYFAWTNTSTLFRIDLDSIQLEEGTTATTYEPYKSSNLLANVPLRSLPNGVRDRVYEADGQMWLEKNVEEYVLDGSDFQQITTNYNSTGLTRVIFTKRTDALGYATNAEDGRHLVEGFTNTTSITNGGMNEELSNFTISLFVPDGTYADLAAAQSDLAGTVIHYQLATPEIINLTEQGLTEGQLDSFSNGTVYNTSDTFHSPEVSFEVPSNRGAQISALLESSNAQAKQLEAKANKAQEDWIEPTLLNGWVNQGGTDPDASYYKDSLGVVHIKGHIKSGTLDTSAFLLPVGYRPKESIWVSGWSSGGTFAGFFITAEGNVKPVYGSTSLFSLNNISFRVEG